MVNSGTGSGSYTNGHVQTISADAISGKTFVAWTGDTAHVADSNSASTTVTMPAQAVGLTATYVDNTYALTVNSGTGGGSFTNGYQAVITANAPGAGMAFNQWTGDTVYLADSNSASTTVTMPAQAVSLTATYIATEQYTTNAIPVPYSWLEGYGITNNQNTAVLLDPDGDGLTTEQEYIVGTVPTNAQSVFAVSNRLTALQVTLQWSATSGRVYSVYRTTNLFNIFQPLETNILWPQNSWTGTVNGSRSDFYKINVQMEQ
jgi:hypothetical protein